MIDGNTKLTGLLGRPVAHSLSPAMHNTAFCELGLNWVYLCFDVGEEELERAVEGMKALGAPGWNVTMPDKNRMATLCDELSGAASIIKAVNTVVNRDGVLTGYSTDGTGFFRAAREHGIDIRGEKMTILGTGGAATAVFVEAALQGAAEITVFGREDALYPRAVEICARLNRETGSRVKLLPLPDDEALRREMSGSRLFVNGTSVGMAPHTDASLVPDPDFFVPGLAVADVIYHPAKTKLLAMAEGRGCTVFNGEGMLLYQGAEAFRLWTGREMPVGLVRRTCFA